VDRLNDTRSKVDGEWRISPESFHFMHDPAVQQIIHRLIYLFVEGHSSKDFFIDSMVQELIVRMLQTEAKMQLSDTSISLNSESRLAFIIQFIRKNLDQPLTIKDLSNRAYMSESNFHRVFKNELNISPIDFINEERIKRATNLLQNPKLKVKEVCEACGFQSLSYFIRLFKKKAQMTPKKYQSMLSRNRA